MPLLTTTNLAAYAPGLPAAAITDTAIYMAESLAYGPNGSGYDLGLTDRIEIKPLSMANEAIPTWAIANLATVTVEFRSARIDNDWESIEASSLEITPRRIRVKTSYQNLTRMRDFGRRGMGATRPLFGAMHNELRITYQSGIDFDAIPETSEVRRLRAALGGIVMAQYTAAQGTVQLLNTTSATGGGQKILKKSVLGGRAEIEYSDPDKTATTSQSLIRTGSSSGEVNGTIADCLAVFQQYRIRPIVG